MGRTRGSLALAALCGVLAGAPAVAQDAAALRAKHAALRAELAENEFDRPLHVISLDSEGTQQGEVYARLAQPYDALRPTLEDARGWCDILILPVNVKRCETGNGGTGDTLVIYVARQPDDSVEDAYRVAFGYDIVAAGPDYLHVTLNAPTGPFGTRNYRISVEAAPLDAGRTFLHLAYSYTPGLVARMAVSLYLATAGRGKVGFSIVGRQPDGSPIHAGGVRGLVERNTMRYYLAIEASLGALDVPPAERFEQRLRDWYAATQRYPAQLSEPVDLEAYLAMKRREARASGF